MGRPKGSKNKIKCCTSMPNCLQDAIATQDAEHLESQNANVIAVIDDNETQSEHESEFYDGIADRNYDSPGETEQEIRAIDWPGIEAVT